MRRLITTLTTLVLGSALALAVPGSAHAASTEFGNACATVSGSTNTTTVYTSRGASNPLPAAAPQSGVITKARITLPPVPGTLPFTVKALRGTGVANQYTVVSQSATLSVGTGTQTYDVRIPVSAGDLLGTSGYAGLYCSTPDAGDAIGVVAGDLSPGQSATFTPQTSYAVPVVATVEPDADKDGFGDTTQDLCPQNASVQTACPVVVLDSFATAQGRSITVVVATTNPSKVTVTGIAKVNGKKIKLKGGTKSVTPGVLAKFKVRVPSKLKAALAGLPPSKSIKVKLTATTTDVVGRVSTDTSTVKLPGTRR